MDFRLAKNYSYHICEIDSDNLAVCPYIMPCLCVMSCHASVTFTSWSAPSFGMTSSKLSNRGGIQKVHSLKISRFPNFDPPCLSLFVFEHPPPPPHRKIRSFWRELTLSPTVSILVKFRDKKLMSTSIFG